MAALLTTQTSDTTGTGASHSCPCTAFVTGTFDGCTVNLLAADADTAGKYVSFGPQSQRQSPGAITVNAYGTYYLRADVVGAGSATSVTVATTQ